jgi:hypothetical protein
MRHIALSLLCLISGTSVAIAQAEEQIVYVATDGTPYVKDITPRGWIFVAPVDDPGDQFFLSADCVVENFKHGTGSWGHDHTGWQISFNNRHQIRFLDTLPPFEADDCLMLR